MRLDAQGLCHQPKALSAVTDPTSIAACFTFEKIRHTFFLVEFPVHPVFAEDLKQEDIREVTPEVKRLLEAMIRDHSRRELQKILGLKDAEHFRTAYLLPAINAGLVEMTLPDKPKSRLQRYRLTESGRALQKLLGGEIRSNK